MNILFKNIPKGTTGYELAEFIESEFNMDSIESKKLAVTICSIEMMERQDSFCHLVEQYGIVRISPPDLAKKVIRRLDGCFFDRLKISVRQYYLRSVGNDPRLNLIDTPEMMMEKRIKDRRRHSLIYSRQI
jgi:hypothetical protein